MPEHLRALLVILVLAGAVFAAARPLACAAAMPRMTAPWKSASEAMTWSAG